MRVDAEISKVGGTQAALGKLWFAWNICQSLTLDLRLETSSHYETLVTHCMNLSSLDFVTRSTAKGFKTLGIFSHECSSFARVRRALTLEYPQHRKPSLSAGP